MNHIAYIFWSIFTSLIPTLFYFSVWELGIAGAELALLSILSPGLLGASFVRRWAATKSGRVTLHVLSFLGLVAYKLPTPFQRLILVTIATFSLCIGSVVDWSGLGGTSVTYQSIRRSSPCSSHVKRLDSTFDSHRTWANFIVNLKISELFKQSRYVYFYISYISS